MPRLTSRECFLFFYRSYPSTTVTPVVIYMCISCIKVDALLVNKGKVPGRDWLPVPTA